MRGELKFVKAEKVALRTMVHIFHHLNPPWVQGRADRLGPLLCACMKIAEWEPWGYPCTSRAYFMHLRGHSLTF